MEKSFEEKVEELWNREQIKSLTYAYGECILRRNDQGMAKLFTDDGVIDFTAIAGGIHKGRDAIAQFYSGTWPARVKPFFTNHYIEFLDNARARGWCWLDNRAVRDGQSVIGCGKIYDEYRRVEGQWLFASRRVAIFFFASLADGWAKQLDELTDVEPRWVGVLD